MRARQEASGDFKPVPVGMHRAVLYLIADLGLQPGGMYAPAYKVALGFQLPDLLSEKGEPLTITQIYTSSMNKKANLRKAIENWFSKQFPSEETANEFEFATLLKRAAFVNVTHTSKGDKTYANISSINSLPAGIEKPEVKGETILFDADLPPAERSAAYAKLPEWLRKKVDGQLQPNREQGAPVAAAAAVDDDIPF